jgi:hypothetical protein
MQSFHLHPTATAQWHSLVCEAAARRDTRLNESLESYLVFLLMRFTSRPEFASRIMALEFLNALRVSGHIQEERLRDVGDQCLLYSGLYPRQAERRNVRLGYFVNLGRSAYDQLARALPQTGADLFEQLCEGFLTLREVLQTIREIGEGGVGTAWEASDRLPRPGARLAPTGAAEPLLGVNPKTTH